MPSQTFKQASNGFGNSQTTQAKKSEEPDKRKTKY
jgi:hypothetical protein